MRRKEKLKWDYEKGVYHTHPLYGQGFQILKYGKKYNTKNFLLTNKNSEIGWFDKLGDAKKCAEIINNG